MECRRCENKKKFEVTLTESSAITVVVVHGTPTALKAVGPFKTLITGIKCCECGYMTNDPSDFGYSGEVANVSKQDLPQLQGYDVVV